MVKGGKTSNTPFLVECTTHGGSFRTCLLLRYTPHPHHAIVFGFPLLSLPFENLKVSDIKIALQRKAHREREKLPDENLLLLSCGRSLPCFLVLDIS